MSRYDARDRFPEVLIKELRSIKSSLETTVLRDKFHRGLLRLLSKTLFQTRNGEGRV
jgi:hypothetical protein